MKTRLDFAVLPGTALRVLVVEGESEAGEPTSSSRLRTAQPAAAEQEPTVPEFIELKKWTKSVKRARGIE
ncbi:MAG TPA: hypothetical protein VG734_25570 [Lacunisphaera sp.]|nr:hypothetical protein [Lacunisphaera sp.]